MTLLRYSLCAFIAAFALATAADASTIIFTTTLDPDQEVHDVDIAPGTDPKGSGRLVLDTTSLLLSWDITFEGLSGPIAGPGAHLHGAAPPGVNAPIQIDLVDVNNLPPGASGPSGRLIGSATLSSTQADDLKDGLWYVNIHTELNPMGEIRGQVNIIPEPATVGMMAMGGAAVALLLRVRRRRPSIKS